MWEIPPISVRCRKLFLSGSFNPSSETHHRYSCKSSTADNEINPVPDRLEHSGRRRGEWVLPAITRSCREAKGGGSRAERAELKCDQRGIWSLFSLQLPRKQMWKRGGSSEEKKKKRRDRAPSGKNNSCLEFSTVHSTSESQWPLLLSPGRQLYPVWSRREIGKGWQLLP